MLKKDAIEKISKLLGTTAEDLTAKIKSEKEEDIKLPEGELFTTEQLTKRDSSKYNEGKEAGQEMLVKDLKKKYSYDFEGKDVDAFISHHDAKLKEKYSKGTDERVKELESDLEKQKKAFQTDIENLTNQKNSLESKYKGERVNGRLLSIMPKETTIDSTDVLTLFKSRYEIVEEDGKEFVVHNGEKLKDTKTQEPLPLDSVFNDFVTERGYVKKTPGRGGGNEPGGTGYSTKMTPGDFQEKWLKNNPDKNLNSPDYQKDYQEFRAKQKETA